MAITMEEFEELFGRFRSDPATRNLDIDGYINAVKIEYAQYSEAVIEERSRTEYVPQLYLQNALEYIIVSNFKRFFLDELAMTISIRENLANSNIETVVFQDKRDVPFPISGDLTGLKTTYEQLSNLFVFITRQLLNLENDNIDILELL